MDYTAIIIDDEEAGAEGLSILIKLHCPEINVIDVCVDSQQAIKLCKLKKPQILFLDIEMPNLNGFDVLKELGNEKFYVIFTTSHKEYAITAIKHNAFDYLLKPIDVKELKEAIEKVKEKILSENYSINQVIANLMQSIKTVENKNKFGISVGGQTFFVDSSDILYFEADSNYTRIFLENQKPIISSKNLKKIEEGIIDDTFIRIHNSYIINLKNVLKYNRGLVKKVIMKDGKELEISRSRLTHFQKIIEKKYPNLF